jgi:crotonobetaine/carnitine-CoA ligase
MLDEVPVAFVVSANPAAAQLLESQILAACRGKLADFKVPRRIYFVEDLPRATLGKVAKEQLRAQLRRSGAEPVSPETPRQ